MSRINRYVLAASMLALLTLPVWALTVSDTRHEARGPITAINHDTGELMMNGPEGALTLHFPAHAVRNLNIGDTITAQYAFSKVSLPDGTTRAYDAPEGSGEHRMLTTVRMVDHKTGELEVNSAVGVLNLRFPSEALRDVDAGDRLMLDLAFTR